MLVAVLVAVAETVCRLAFKDVHSLYHALFTVGPFLLLDKLGRRFKEEAQAARHVWASGTAAAAAGAPGGVGAM